MTDESRFPSEVEVLINGEMIRTLHLENDWADARGMLSWHYQPEERHLDEAGSFGEAQHFDIPTRFISGIAKEGGFTLTVSEAQVGQSLILGMTGAPYTTLTIGIVVEPALPPVE
jgi:hypothetical protein